MRTWLIAYGVALLVVGLLDAVWLGWLARDFYRREMGTLMADSIRWAPALLFYFGYPAGLVTLALQPTPADLSTAVLRAALFGLVVYGVYDMTNMATLRHWSWRLAAVDIAWGTAVAATAGAAAWLLMRRVA
jgi:uncharacterized membrane protein